MNKYYFSLKSKRKDRDELLERLKGKKYKIIRGAEFEFYSNASILAVKRNDPNNIIQSYNQLGAKHDKN